MKVLGINDEITTCECCGRSGLKKTVVLGTDAGEVRYGTECAARAMKCGKVDVERAVKAAEREAIAKQQAAANAEWDIYAAWLVATYGDAKSNMERRKAWRASLAA